ncbi:HdeD family acid-resistance protein [Spirillospora sp. NPDC047279]|uniref:HdeD family acid-resistance protein n=1 Tax=Spirillospora sp. NPDC047279 TaxID=3155478 RepID=UPI0033E59406
MFDLMARNWWVLALRGAFAILFGVVAWIWPGITVWALVILFGAYALVDGVFALIGAFGKNAAEATGRSRGWLAVTGVAGIVLGIVALAWPGITGFALLMLIAAWAVVTGVFEIFTAFSLRKKIDNEWLYIVTGAISVLFGVLLFVWPVSGALAVVWMIGFFSILFGAFMVGAAFRLRKLGHEAEKRGGMTAGGASAAHS